jgi:alcohol dehydrogenase class IV
VDLLNTFDLIGIRYHHVIINREPTPDIIDQAVVRYCNFTVKLIIAIGGGSVIDSGKAISAMLNINGSIAEYLEGVGNSVHPGNKIPFIAVPTTSGTGSEATNNAVISHTGHNGFKKSLRHNNFIPDIAVLDPELSLSCTQEQTAISGMDCFSQLMEAYLSEKSYSYTDILALEGIKAIKNSLLRAWTWGQDLEARAGMTYAAFLSGICLNNAGLGAVHGLSSSIGGSFHIPHGAICATLLGVTNKVTVNKLRSDPAGNQALAKYSNIGKVFTCDTNKSQEYYIDLLLDTIEELIEKLRIKRLSEYGVKQDDISKIVLKTSCKSHPVKLSTVELTQILEARL